MLKNNAISFFCPLGVPKAVLRVEKSAFMERVKPVRDALRRTLYLFGDGTNLDKDDEHYAVFPFSVRVENLTFKTTTPDIITNGVEEYLLDERIAPTFSYFRFYGLEGDELLKCKDYPGVDKVYRAVRNLGIRVRQGLEDGEILDA